MVNFLALVFNEDLVQGRSPFLLLPDLEVRFSQLTSTASPWTWKQAWCRHWGYSMEIVQKKSTNLGGIIMLEKDNENRRKDEL